MSKDGAAGRLLMLADLRRYARLGIRPITREAGSLFKSKFNSFLQSQAPPARNCREVRVGIVRMIISVKDGCLTGKFDRDGNRARTRCDNSTHQCRRSLPSSLLHSKYMQAARGHVVLTALIAVPSRAALHESFQHGCFEHVPNTTRHRARTFPNASFATGRLAARLLRRQVSYSSFPTC